MRAQLSPGAVRCPQSSVVLSSSSSPSEHLREPSSSRAGNKKKDTRCAASGRTVGGATKGSISAMERSSALVLGRPKSIAPARGCWARLGSEISWWKGPTSVAQNQGPPARTFPAPSTTCSKRAGAASIRAADPHGWRAGRAGSIIVRQLVVVRASCRGVWLQAERRGLDQKINRRVRSKSQYEFPPLFLKNTSGESFRIRGCFGRS